MALLKASDIVSLIDSLAEAKIEQYLDFSTASVKSHDDLLSLMQIKTQLDLLEGMLQIIDILQNSQLGEQDIKNMQERLRTKGAAGDSAHGAEYANLENILKRMDF